MIQVTNDGHISKSGTAFASVKERIIDTGRTVEAMGFAALADQLAGGGAKIAPALDRRQ